MTKDFFAGRRVLVVEDEGLLALALQDIIEELGADVAGPAATLEKGLALAREEVLDAAVLDVNLKGRNSFPIADRLRRRAIPYIFATGYSADLPQDGLGVPVVVKPYDDAQIAAALRAVLPPR